MELDTDKNQIKNQEKRIIMTTTRASSKRNKSRAVASNTSRRPKSSTGSNNGAKGGSQKHRSRRNSKNHQSEPNDSATDDGRSEEESSDDEEKSQSGGDEDLGDEDGLSDSGESEDDGEDVHSDTRVLRKLLREQKRKADRLKEQLQEARQLQEVAMERVQASKTHSRKKRKKGRQAESLNLSQEVEKQSKALREATGKKEEFRYLKNTEYDYSVESAVSKLQALLTHLTEATLAAMTDGLDITEIVRLHTLRSLLRGEALRDFEDLARAAPNDDDSFKFLPVSFEFVHEQLVRLAESNTVIARKRRELPKFENLSQYSKDFVPKFIASKENLPREQLIALFTRGVPKELRDSVSRVLWEDKELNWQMETGDTTEPQKAEARSQFIRELQAVFTNSFVVWRERIEKDIALTESKEESRNKMTINKVHFSAMETKKRKYDKPNPNAQRETSKKLKGGENNSSKCFKCGEIGHFSGKCNTVIREQDWCRKCDKIITVRFSHLRHHFRACKGVEHTKSLLSEKKSKKERMSVNSISARQLRAPAFQVDNNHSALDESEQERFQEEAFKALDDYRKQQADFRPKGRSNNNKTGSPRKYSISSLPREHSSEEKEGEASSLDGEEEEEKVRERWRVHAIGGGSEDSAFISLITINKQRIHNILVDSGALTKKNGLITERKANELHLKIKRKRNQTNCEAANGTEIELIGTVTLEVQLPEAPHGEFEKLEMHVVKDEQRSFTTQIILGRKTLGRVFKTTFQDDELLLEDKHGHTYGWRPHPVMLFHLKMPTEKNRQRPTEPIEGKMFIQDGLGMTVGEEEKVELKLDEESFLILKERPSTLVCTQAVPIRRGETEYILKPRGPQVEVRGTGKRVKCFIHLTLQRRDHQTVSGELAGETLVLLEPDEQVLQFTTDESELPSSEEHPDGGETYDDGIDIEGVRVGNPLEDTDAFQLEEDRAQERIGKDLGEEFEQGFLDLLMKFEVVFTGEVTYRPGNFTAPFRTFKIPRFYPSYPMSAAKEKALREYILRYLKAGLLIVAPFPVRSAAPVIVLQKPGPNGGFRIVLDYSKPGQLNECLEFEQSRNPDPRRVRRDQRHRLWKTQLDIKSAFFHIPIPEECIPHTSFMTPWGVAYSFRVLPMGAKSSPAIMQRFMLEEVLPIEKFSPNDVTIYQDDILLEADTKEGLLKLTRRVLEAFKEKGVVLSLEKCSFGVKEVEFLGRVLSADATGIPEKALGKLDQWPRPKNVKEVRAFLGFAGFYDYHIPNFAELRHPLDELISAKKFEWRGIHTKAWEQIKLGMVQHKFVWNPDPSRPFGLLTDASLIAAGAVAFQIFEGKPRPIAFFSRKFNERERRIMAVHELEAIAILRALKHFSYLLPPNENTYVYSDSKSLLWLRESTENRLLRISYQLRHFNFTLTHIPGEANPADYLSRPPSEMVKIHAMNVGATIENEQRGNWDDSTSVNSWDTHEEEIERESEELLNPYAIPDLLTGEGKQWLRTAQEEDPEMGLLLRGIEAQEEHDMRSFGRALRAEQKKRGEPVTDRKKVQALDALARTCKVEDGVLLVRPIRNHPHVIWIPEPLRGETLFQMHNGLRGCHFGRDRTEHRVRQNFYWKGLSEDVRHYVKECIECSIAKSTRHHKAGKYRRYKVTHPMQLVTMDLMGPIEKVGGKYQKYVLVCVDSFSGFHWYIPMDKATAEETTKAIMRSICQSFNLPSVILTDQGRNFTSNKFKKWCKDMSIDLIHAPARHHQASGKAERAIRELKLSMTALLESGAFKAEDWQTLCMVIAVAHNSSPLYKSINLTPYQVMFGDLNGPAIPTPLSVDKLMKTLGGYSEERVEVVTKAIAAARERAAEVLNKVYLKRYNQINADRYDVELRIGDEVVRKYTANRGHRDTRALRSANEGVYRVIDRLSPTVFVIYNDKEVYEQHVSELTKVPRSRKAPKPISQRRTSTLTPTTIKSEMGEQIVPLELALPHLAENGKVTVRERRPRRQTLTRNIEEIDAYSLEMYLVKVKERMKNILEEFEKKTSEEQEQDVATKNLRTSLKAIEDEIENKKKVEVAESNRE